MFFISRYLNVCSFPRTTSCHHQNSENETFNGKHQNVEFFFFFFQISYQFPPFSLPVFSARIHGFPFAIIELKVRFNANTSFQKNKYFNVSDSFFLHVWVPMPHCIFKAKIQCHSIKLQYTLLDCKNRETLHSSLKKDRHGKIKKISEYQKTKTEI